MSDLPRPLRDAGLVEAIRTKDAEFAKAKRAGSLTIVVHYDRDGVPRKAKTVIEYEHVLLTGPAKTA